MTVAQGTLRIALVTLLAAVATGPVETGRAYAADGGGQGGAPPVADGVQSQQAWAMSRLARADELLRHNRRRAAGRLFMEVFEAAQGTPWAGFAELGLAWSAVASGDLATARYLSGDALHDAGPAGEVAEVLIALLDGSQGQSVNAVNRLTRVLGSQAAGAGRNTVQLARGYVRYWANDFDSAASDFAEVVAEDATGLLADDGRYGAARAQLAAGNRETAVVALREILMRAPPDAGHSPTSEALVNLQARAVLRESFKRYRRGGVQMPGAQLARLLDFDGVSRARAALRMLEQEGKPSLAHGRSVTQVVSGAAAPAPAAPPAARVAPATGPARDHDVGLTAPPSAVPRATAPRRVPAWAALLSVAALVMLLLLLLTRKVGGRVGAARRQQIAVEALLLGDEERVRCALVDAERASRDTRP